MANYYFLSDAHLGTPVVADRRQHELALVAWLDMAAKDADAIFLLGDIFDFWFEYRTVVPKGFNRLLGKLCEITDRGIEVHFFIGNHDLWTFGYLEQEIGLVVHRQPTVMTLCEKQFFLAHGDGLHDKSCSFSLLRSIFHNKLCQKAFAALPPAVGLNIGHRWSANNRRKHDAMNVPFLGEEHEALALFAKEHAASHTVDYYIFGHRHILLHLMLNRQNQMIILGDFIHEFSYAVFDGSAVTLHHFNPPVSVMYNQTS
ncbi:MAG: UDP-2,3-diacylglucosamine diphosphatase [Prevotellaceae bacterium]|jgi:UDP-2,3-diacylglucosamine hydrolase|nr:UDP-2,3-diacylglucosamine diphosphatase [Prevotellaceae bacterium]